MKHSHTWTEPRPDDLDALLSSYETPAFWGKGSVLDDEFDGSEWDQDALSEGVML